MADEFLDQLKQALHIGLSDPKKRMEWNMAVQRLFSQVIIVDTGTFLRLDVVPVSQSLDRVSVEIEVQVDATELPMAFRAEEYVFQ